MTDLQISQLNPKLIPVAATDQFGIDDTTSLSWKITVAALQIYVNANLPPPLLSIAGLTTVANQMIYTTASNTYATTPITTFGRSVLNIAAANNGVFVTDGTGVASVSSTLPNAVQDNITRLGTITSGVWNGSLIPMDFGGTNKNLIAANGGIFYSDADSFEILAPVATAGKMFQSGANAAPSWSTPTYPSASGSSGKLLISDGINNIYSTPTYPNAAGTAGKIILSDGTNFIISTSTFPTTAGTAGSIVISDGTNKINSTSLWTNTVGSSGKMIRSDGTINTYSTATFADTYAVSTILYASASNQVTGLASAVGGVLVSNSSSIPSMLANPGATGRIFQSVNNDASAWSTATYPSAAITSGTILRANGTNWLASTATFADTYAVSTILYASASNQVSGLTTGNSSTLITSSGGVPSFSQTLPSAVQGNITTLGTLVSSVLIQYSQAGAAVSLTTTNTNNASSTADALNFISVGGASGGDPYNVWAIGSAQSYALGIDNSDSDIFKLTSSASAGAAPSSGTTIFQMTSAGVASFFGNFSINTNVASTSQVTFANTNNTAGAGMLANISVGGSSADDPTLLFTVGGATNFIEGIDNSDSDKFKRSVGTALGTNDYEVVTTAGIITYPLQVAFLAYLASTANNKTGNGTAYTLGTDALTKIFDQGSNFNTNGTFTSPVTARYNLGSSIMVTGCTIASTFTNWIQTSNRNYYNYFVRAAGAGNMTMKNNVLADMDAADTAVVNITVTGEAADTDDIYGDSTVTTGFWGYLAA